MFDWLIDDKGVYFWTNVSQKSKFWTKTYFSVKNQKKKFVKSKFFATIEIMEMVFFQSCTYNSSGVYCFFTGICPNRPVRWFPKYAYGRCDTYRLWPLADLFRQIASRVFLNFTATTWSLRPIAWPGRARLRPLRAGTLRWFVRAGRCPNRAFCRGILIGSGWAENRVIDFVSGTQF